MSQRFTPEDYREEARLAAQGNNTQELAAMLRQAAEDAEDVAAWRKQYAETLTERDEARAIAQRWHELGSVAVVDAASSKDYQADAATIAGWSNPSKSVVKIGVSDGL